MRKGRFLGAVLAGLMAGCAVPSGRAMGRLDNRSAGIAVVNVVGKFLGASSLIVVGGDMQCAKGYPSWPARRLPCS
jgi:hypothetical protein